MKEGVCAGHVAGKHGKKVEYAACAAIFLIHVSAGNGIFKDVHCDLHGVSIGINSSGPIRGSK